MSNFETRVITALVLAAPGHRGPGDRVVSALSLSFAFCIAAVGRAAALRPDVYEFQCAGLDQRDCGARFVVVMVFCSLGQVGPVFSRCSS